MKKIVLAALKKYYTKRGRPRKVAPTPIPEADRFDGGADIEAPKRHNPYLLKPQKSDLQRECDYWGLGMFRDGIC